MGAGVAMRSSKGELCEAGIETTLMEVAVYDTDEEMAEAAAKATSELSSYGNARGVQAARSIVDRTRVMRD